MIDKIIDCIKYLWDAPFAREVFLVVITAIVTHFFDSRKQRNEQKRRYLETVGSRISDALVCAREICEKTRAIEVFTDDGKLHTENAKDTNAFRDYAWYPGFMTEKETLAEFVSAVAEARAKHEPYLDLVSASYLYVLEKYLFDLLLYVKQNELMKSLPLLGCAVIFDIQKWEQSFDRHLVKQINQPHYKLFSRHGNSWEKAKKTAEQEFLKESELQKLMLGTSEFPIVLAKSRNVKPEKRNNCNKGQGGTKVRVSRVPKVHVR